LADHSQSYELVSKDRQAFSFSILLSEFFHHPLSP